MTGFSSFAFAATSASASLTLPARLSHIVNVKDWGAIGDGISNDATAIQAAIDYSLTSIGNPGQGIVGTIIFFPPGTYNVGSTTIILDNTVGGGGGSLEIVGAGREATTVIGTNNSGFIFDHQQDQNTVHYFADMTVKNLSTTSGTGAIRIDITTSNFPVYENLHLIGYYAAFYTHNPFNVTWISCIFECSGNRTSGSVGTFTWQGAYYSCQAIGFDVGFAVEFTCLTVYGCRATNCNTGYYMGLAPPGSDVGGDRVLGLGFFANVADNCDMGYFVNNINGGVLAANVHLGSASWGLRATGLWSGEISANALLASVPAGQSIDLYGSNSVGVIRNATMIAMEGAGGWTLMPGNLGYQAGNWGFISCGTPTGANPNAFLDYVSLSDPGERTIVDGQKSGGGAATYGDVVVGGGSSQYKVRWNGGNAVRIG